jgi:non-specific serine/threonine protein kinase/serine/threonine-protein kinase
VTPEQWKKIRPILESALATEPANRVAFLDEACVQDHALRDEVESLIISHDEAGTNALNPGSGLDLIPEYEARFRLLPGKRIGAYEILGEIAVGGMGAVYRAIRADGQYRQQVALKIVRAELGADLVASRFKNERQILASLDHPNIARILDGGTTADGIPYFVMELLDDRNGGGLPITEYCDKHKLSIDERLRVFRTVCSAVHYAHQHLVVHRDIKPANILITAEGVPKLLDFGIAKILDPALLPENATLTAAGLWMMTPEYASPEQLRGETITTATDVYSLGLVLYQLLAGHPAHRFASRLPHEITRAILETEPEKPSTAVRRAKDAGNENHGVAALTPELLSSLRGDSPEKLQRRLAGDLDNIVMKAIRKEPPERYLSVDQLSEDLRRHLDGLPVLARKNTTGYRCRKFVIRHKLQVTAAALVLLSVLTGMVLTVREARIARANEIRAERRFADVRRLANSLIFDIHDSVKDLPGSTPARKLIVERALEYLDSLSQESQGDLSLQRELAVAYERVGLVQGHYLQDSLGDTNGSLVSYQKALKIREQVAARSSDWNDRVALAQAYRLVANQQWALGDHTGALKSSTAAVASSEAVKDAHPKNLKILQELASDYEIAGQVQRPTYAGGPIDVAKAAESFQKAIVVDEIMLTIDPDNPSILFGYANDLLHTGAALEGNDDKAALERYTKVLGIEENLHQRSADVRYTRGIARAYSHIGETYERMGDYPRSCENFARGLEIYKQLIRADPKNVLFHQGLAIAYANTAVGLRKTGHKTMSLDYMEKSLELMRAVIASDPDNRQQRGYLAVIAATSGSNFMHLGKAEGALREFDEARAIYESFHKADTSETEAAINAAACKEKMGEAASLASKPQLAEQYFQQALSVVEPLLSAKDPDSQRYAAVDAYSGLGDLKLQEARQLRQGSARKRESWTQARSWYLKSIDARRRIEHPSRTSPNGFDVGDPRRVTQNLQLCVAALSEEKDHAKVIN